MTTPHESTADNIAESNTLGTDDVMPVAPAPQPVYDQPSGFIIRGIGRCDGQRPTRAWHECRGLTLQALADAASVSQPIIYELSNSSVSPRFVVSSAFTSLSVASLMAVAMGSCTTEVCISGRTSIACLSSYVRPPKLY